MLKRIFKDIKLRRKSREHESEHKRQKNESSSSCEKTSSFPSLSIASGKKSSSSSQLQSQPLKISTKRKTFSFGAEKSVRRDSSTTTFLPSLNKENEQKRSRSLSLCRRTSSEMGGKNDRGCYNQKHAFSEYLEDQLEKEMDLAPVNYMKYQVQEVVNLKSRMEIIEVMMWIFSSLQLEFYETIFVAIKVLDMFLSRRVVKDSHQLYIVGLASIFSASKSEECYNMIYSDILYNLVTDKLGIFYQRKDLVKMEKFVMKEIDFRLKVPTIFNFLCEVLEMDNSSNLNIKDSPKKKKEKKGIREIATFLCLYGAFNYNLMRSKPSLVAVAAVAMAKSIWYNTPECSVKKFCCGQYLLRNEVDDVLDCAKKLYFGGEKSKSKVPFLKKTFSKVKISSFGNKRKISVVNLIKKWKVNYRNK